MTHTRLPLLLVALALAAMPGAVAAAPAAAAAAVGGTYPAALGKMANDGVLDEAQLFSPEATAAVQKQIRQIRTDYHIAVFIDTVPKAPAADWSEATSWSGQKRYDYFHNWAKERSRAFGVEGVHVLICKQPRQVAVVVWPERFESEFGATECKSIERLLTRHLVSAPDETLLTTLDHIRTGLRTQREPEPSVAFGPLGLFIGGTVGLWLLLCVARLRLRKPQPFSMTGEPQTVRLTAGLLAGMFGNPAAFWITDQLFPHEATGSSYEMLVQDVPAAEVPAPSAEASPEETFGDLEPMPEHAEVRHD